MRRVAPSGSSVRRGILLAAVLVLAGCSAPVVSDGDPASTPHSPGAPESDRLGWENGYWYDSDLPVTPGDGYNASERAAVVARAMARVEQVRQREFEETVPVEVVTREQYLRNRSGSGGSATYRAWNEQVWEGLFLVSEDETVSDDFNSTLGTSVQGYYSSSEERIVLVSDSSTPTIDRGTLAHELVHALQDQQFGLGGSPETQDRQLAADSVTEGEANYVEDRYQRRCGSQWSCIPAPEGGSSPSLPPEFNRGLYLTVYTPYAVGPDFVDSVRERRGWSGVSALHEGVPESTEQVIHPGRYPDAEPANVSVPDRSSDEWRRFDRDPVADTVGEASIYAMLVDNGAVRADGNERLEYDSVPSAGWGGDALVPYTDGETGAYVWETVWDSREDARQFADAYREVLAAHDARNPREGVYVVPESDPYDDAFRVVRDGTAVRVVNAPTVDGLDAVHDPP